MPDQQLPSMPTTRRSHDFTSSALPPLLAKAVKQYSDLSATLYEIQQLTGIPGLHTNINSDDDTPGVLERIQLMADEGLTGDDVLASFIDLDTAD